MLETGDNLTKAQTFMKHTVLTCEQTLFILSYSPAQETSKKVKKMSSLGALIEPRGARFQRWHHPFMHNYINVSFSSPLNGAEGQTQPGQQKKTGFPPFFSTSSNVYSENGNVDISFRVQSHYNAMITGKQPLEYRRLKGLMVTFILKL